MGATQKAPRVLFTNISASTLIRTGVGTFWGFYVNSTSSGVLVIYDSLSAAGTKIMNTVTPAIGPHIFNFGVEFNTGLYVSLSSGSIDMTVFWRPRE